MIFVVFKNDIIAHFLNFCMNIFWKKNFKASFDKFDNVQLRYPKPNKKTDL